MALAIQLFYSMFSKQPSMLTNWRTKISTNLTLSPSSVNRNAQTVKVSVTVANTGSRTGKEVVQVYAIDDNSSVVTPNQELIAFTKVEVAWVLS